MARFDRAIDIAFDRNSAEVLDASEVFDTQKHGAELRRRFNRDLLELSCCECDQRLIVSKSSLGRHYFRHEPGHHPCLLTDYDLTPREMEQLRRIIYSRESDRHKHLKNLIAERIRSVPGIAPDSITIDNHFIFENGEKRKPDVYCRYEDKELAFEIQLSNLSLRYILDRHEFYKRRGIYLIWILDKFDLHSQLQMELDIKYLNKYHNFFKLDETVPAFQLQCDYKYHYLTPENEMYTKWATRSVLLSQLKFDTQEFQAYYFDFEADRAKIDADRLASETATREAERKKRYEELKAQASGDAEQVIAAIKANLETGSMIYDHIYRKIAALNPLGVTVLNEKLGFLKPRPSGQPAINTYLRNATRNDLELLRLLLDEERIWLNVNGTGPDRTTALQEVYCNPALINKSVYTAKLLRRGYRLTESDHEYLREHNVDLKSVVLCEVADRLTDRAMVPDVFSNTSLIYILESARRQQIVGYSYPPDAWVAFGNNALHPSYARHWVYIETAFRRYGIWDIILLQDQPKGTFRRKLAARMDNLPDQDYALDDLFKDLFFDLNEKPPVN